MSDGTITLDTIMKSIATLELLYPKKRIVKYMTMCGATRAVMIARINPVQVSTCGMSDAQVSGLRFGCIEMRVDDAIPDGTVKMYNSDDELVQECRL